MYWKLLCTAALFFTCTMRAQGESVPRCTFVKKFVIQSLNRINDGTELERKLELDHPAWLEYYKKPGTNVRLLILIHKKRNKSLKLGDTLVRRHQAIPCLLKDRSTATLEILEVIPDLPPPPI